eukprot:2775466-Prymnesium_polylepis.1
MTCMRREQRWAHAAAARRSSRRASLKCTALTRRRSTPTVVDALQLARGPRTRSDTHVEAPSERSTFV